MEGQGVHWPYMVNTIHGLAMALERVFFGLGGG
jgi:hypothetical protein